MSNYKGYEIHSEGEHSDVSNSIMISNFIISRHSKSSYRVLDDFINDLCRYLYSSCGSFERFEFNEDEGNKLFSLFKIFTSSGNAIDEDSMLKYEVGFSYCLI